MFAGFSTGTGMLNNWVNDYEEEDIEESSIGNNEENNTSSDSPFKNLTKEEIELLESFVKLLDIHKDRDPKYDLLKKIITENYIVEPWLNKGCIIFSQYFDTIKWVCDRFALDFPSISFGLYAGSDKSGIYENGMYCRKSKEDIKKMVRNKQLKLLFGTDAASEGLNLQALGSLINLDLPWDPTRLEQRKGRIQRIGQEREEIYIYNMRYKDSVEDRVHTLLASRLKNVQDLFGQIPDTLEDIWVEVALNKIEAAERQLNSFAENDIHPFYNKYQNQENVKPINWEDCSVVLDNYEKRKHLSKGW
jgi:superfamily II DNA/RNA helicase